MTNYDSLHEEWDKVHFEYKSPTYLLRKKIILNNIEQIFSDKKGLNCLDVGCGTGDYSFELATRNFCVQSFDFSQYAIDKAKEKQNILEIQNINFQRDDIFQYTTQEKFDLVLISEVLEHIKDDLFILKKYSSLVKDSGYIIISVPFDEKLWSYEDEHVGHVRRYNCDRINDIFSQSNMLVIKSIVYGYPLLRYLWKIKSMAFFRSKNKSNIKMTSLNSSAIKFLGRLIVLIDSLFLNSNKGVGIIIIAKNSSNKLKSDLN